MDLAAIQRTVARGLSEVGCEDEFAAAIARLKGWRGSIANHRRRVWNALSGSDPREFGASWVLLAVRLFAYYDRSDLCAELVGHLMRAQWEGDRLRAENPPRAMRRVEPAARKRHRGAA